MVDETPEVKVKLDSPKTDPKTPSSLKSARESLGAHLRHELVRESLHTLTGDDRLSNLISPNQNISDNTQGNTVRAEGGVPFGGSPSASTLRPQTVRERSPEAISGTDVVQALNKLNVSVVTGFNNLGQGINALTLASSLTNSNLNKISSTLGSINTSIDRQKNTLDDIADSLSKSRYEQPGKGKDFASGSSDLGRIGPSLENKSASQEKTEDDLKHNIMEALKEGIVKAGEMALGVWGGLKIGGAGAAAPTIAPVAKPPIVEAAPTPAPTAPPLGGGAAATSKFGFDKFGLGTGLIAATNLADLALHGRESLPWKMATSTEGASYISPDILPATGGREGWIHDVPKHQGRNKLGHRHHDRPHHPKSIFQELFGVGEAEAATEAGDPRQLGPSAVEKANPAVERTDKPVQVTSEAVNVDAKNAPSNVDIKGDNITLNIGGESFLRVMKEAFAGMVLGGAAGSIIPGAGTLAGAGVGAATGIGKGILDEFKGSDFAKLKESFKEGRERAEHDMSAEGIRENRKAFMDRSGITGAAEELNRGSATMGMPVDVNQPGLYTGGRMEAPQGIGGAGGHFGVGGITMPETPGGLGVRGIGKGSPGGGPAFQQHGVSGGPITVQPRQGPPMGRGSGTHAKGNLAANQSEAYNAAIAEGLSPTAAKALVANMSGESLSNPHLVKKDYNSRGQFVHMAHGIVQWDDVRSSAIKKEFHKTPEQMSVAEQTKAAIWEMKTKYPTAWKALKEGNDPQAMIHSLVHDYEMPADKAKAIGQRMGFYRGLSPDIGKQKEAQADKPSKGESSSKGEDPKNMKARPGESVEEMASRIKQMAPHMESEQCVALAKAAVNAPGSTKDWRRGEQVKGKDIPIGTPIATFMDPHGKPSEQYAGGTGGKAGANRDHAGVFAGYEYDKNGKEIGYKIDEQYKGSGGPHIKSYRYGDKRGGEKDASNYYTINNKQGEPLGDKKLNPMWNHNKQEVHASIDLGGSSGGAGASGGWTPINEEKHQPEMAKPSLGSLSSKYEGKVGTVGGDHGRAYGKYQFDYKAKGLQTFFKENPEYAHQFAGLSPGSHAFNNRWKKIATTDPKGFEEAQDKAAKAKWYDPAAKHAEEIGFNTENRGVQESIFSGSIQHGGIKKIEDMAAENKNFKNMSPEEQIHSFYKARMGYVQQHSHLHGSRLAGVLNRYKREEPEAIKIASRDPVTRGERGGASPHSPPSPVTRAPAMLYTPRGEQAHGLTPPHRDPEMSRTIPSHNQELREMSHARAASHEKAKQHRPTPAAHAGATSHHTPEASSGKHTASPYGDISHFDSGLRDRFLSQYLDGHG